MIIAEIDIPDAVGAGALLLGLFTYCITIRRVNAAGAGPSPARLRCNARCCFLTALLSASTGVFEIAYYNAAVWGWILILLSIVWMVRGNKQRSAAAHISAGYQSFNNDLNINRHGNSGSHNESSDGKSSHRQSSGPQIVIVSDNAMFSPVGSSLQQPMMQSNSVIRNAVPPSPFSGNQGSDPYIVPSIPMAITRLNTSRPGSPTPRTTSTLGYAEEEEEERYADHKEDDVDDDDDDKCDQLDERKLETPRGPPGTSERKTSEGNETFS